MNEMEKLKEKQEELRKEIEKLDIQINELTEQREKSKRWRGKRDERYWFISESGEVYNTMETSDERDKASYKIGNYFRTEEEAKDIVEKINIYTQLKDLALKLNKGEKIDWDNTAQAKWNIGFSDNAFQLCCAYRIQGVDQIYCLDSDFLNIAIEEIGEDNLKKLFK